MNANNDNINGIKEGLEQFTKRFTEKISNTITSIETVDQVFKVLRQIMNQSKPIDPNAKYVHSMLFQTCYKDANPSLVFKNFKIKWAILANHIGFPNTPFAPNEGIGVFYVVNNSSPENLRPCFVIGRALRTTIGTMPVVVPISTSGQFLMLEDSHDNGTLISQQEFDNYSNAYKQTIKFQDVHPPTINYEVKNYTHPIVTFHDGLRFTNFFDNNFPPGTTIPQTLKISIENGASLPQNIFSATGTPLLICLHSCMLFFENNGQLLLDDIDDPNLEFKNKGLDVGRLCPPDC